MRWCNSSHSAARGGDLGRQNKEQQERTRTIAENPPRREDKRIVETENREQAVEQNQLSPRFIVT